MKQMFLLVCLALALISNECHGRPGPASIRGTKAINRPQTLAYDHTRNLDSKASLRGCALWGMVCWDQNQNSTDAVEDAIGVMEQITEDLKDKRERGFNIRFGWDQPQTRAIAEQNTEELDHKESLRGCALWGMVCWDQNQNSTDAVEDAIEVMELVTKEMKEKRERGFNVRFGWDQSQTRAIAEQNTEELEHKESLRGCALWGMVCWDQNQNSTDAVEDAIEVMKLVTKEMKDKRERGFNVRFGWDQSQTRAIAKQNTEELEHKESLRGCALWGMVCWDQNQNSTDAVEDAIEVMELVTKEMKEQRERGFNVRFGWDQSQTRAIAEQNTEELEHKESLRGCSLWGMVCWDQNQNSTDAVEDAIEVMEQITEDLKDKRKRGFNVRFGWDQSQTRAIAEQNTEELEHKESLRGCALWGMVCWDQNQNSTDAVEDAIEVMEQITEDLKDKRERGFNVQFGWAQTQTRAIAEQNMEESEHRESLRGCVWWGVWCWDQNQNSTDAVEHTIEVMEQSAQFVNDHTQRFSK